MTDREKLIDRKIRSIVGEENFREWDDRYNQRRGERSDKNTAKKLPK